MTIFSSMTTLSLITQDWNLRLNELRLLPLHPSIGVLIEGRCSWLGSTLSTPQSAYLTSPDIAQCKRVKTRS
jgi:hypothetical protein